jgi:hypothetical protein
VFVDEAISVRSSRLEFLGVVLVERPAKYGSEAVANFPDHLLLRSDARLVYRLLSATCAEGSEVFFGDHLSKPITNGSYRLSSNLCNVRTGDLVRGFLSGDGILLGR